MSEGAGAAAKDLARRYFQMWNTGDASIADDILSPSWVDHAHPEVSGLSDVKRAVTAVREARSDLRFHVEAVLDAGAADLVAVVGGVGREDAAPTHRLIWLFRHDNDRMTEMFTFQESAG